MRVGLKLETQGTRMGKRKTGSPGSMRVGTKGEEGERSSTRDVEGTWGAEEKRVGIAKVEASP